MSTLLFDLGGTYLRAGLLTAHSTVEHVRKWPIRSVVHGLEPAAIWNGVLGRIASFQADVVPENHSDAPSVVSFPGPVVDRRRTLQAPTVVGPESGEVDFAAEVERVTRNRVIVLNDVSAAAWRISELFAINRFLVVTVSSGVGSKIFDRYHPLGVLDGTAYAGEIGHVVVDDSADAPQCDCGARGHLGAISSGRGIERQVRRLARVRGGGFANSVLATRFGASPENLNNHDHIVPAVLAGDEWTTGIVKQCTRPLVRSLLTVALGCGLERIFVIGGFASALGECYLQLLRQLARDLTHYAPMGDEVDRLFELVRSEVCLEGCAAFVRGGGLLC